MIVDLGRADGLSWIQVITYFWVGGFLLQEIGKVFSYFGEFCFFNNGFSVIFA